MNEALIEGYRIEKVGFVSALPNGETLVHDWGFVYRDNHREYTVGDLRKISEDFYGDMLEPYRRSSSHGLWVKNT